MKLRNIESVKKLTVKPPIFTLSG